MIAVLISNNATLTTSQLLQAGEWFYDLTKERGAGLGGYLKENQLDRILTHAQWDPRQKANKLLEALRKLRFPRWTQCEAKFESATSEICSPESHLKIEASASFEGEGFSLHAKLKDPEALEKFVSSLKDKRHLLNSLFDIML